MLTSIAAIFTTLGQAIPDFLVVNAKQKNTTYCLPGSSPVMPCKFSITHISLTGNAESHQKKNDNELKILLHRSRQ